MTNTYDFKSLLDFGIITLFLCAVVSLIASMLFRNEWKRLGSASVEFIYLTIMFFLISVTQTFHLVARVLFHLRREWFDIFLDTYAWQFRYVPLTIIISMIVYRIIRKNRERKQLETKKEGGRK